VLISDMREVPKVLHTTPTGKPIGGTGLIALPNGKNCKNVTMDNPPTIPNAVMQGYGTCPNDYQESA
jgi:hypothetical protein